jgi:NADP-dependent 3-hydroxy acid dehydrogenase YdfG
VHALALDITSDADIARTVAAASDVDLLINNAGIAPEGDVRGNTRRRWSACSWA